MTTYALLVRVSTLHQAKAHGVPEQLKACRAYAALAGFAVGDEYVDQISGASETRESFYRLLDEAHLYAGVIVDHTDRIGRDEEISHRLLRQLWAAGLEIHSAHRGGLVERDLQTSMEIAFAAEERRRTLIKTQRALIAEAEKGLLPNGIHLFGYRNVPGQNKAEVNPEEARVVRQVFQLAAAPMSYRAVAKEMMARGHLTMKGSKLWYQHTARRVVINSAYKGDFLWRHKTRTYTLSVPPIVDPDLWAQAQKRKVGAKQKLGFPLTGRVRCGRCGLGMSARKVARAGEPVYLYYRCNSHKEPSGKCGAPLVRRDKLEAAVESELRRVLSDRDELAQIFQSGAEQERSQKVAAETAALSAERGRVLELARRGLMGIDEADEIISGLRAKLRALAAPVELDYPLDEYVAAAAELPFAELLYVANVTAIVLGDEVTLSLGGL